MCKRGTVADPYKLRLWELMKDSKIKSEAAGLEWDIADALDSVWPEIESLIRTEHGWGPYHDGCKECYEVLDVINTIRRARGMPEERDPRAS
jgi:hypothetical protein